MFTGIVEEMGEVVRLERRAGGATLLLGAPSEFEGDKPGDSIAINGACLTLEAVEGAIGRFFLSEETLSRTNLGGLRPRDRVNIERALKAGERMGGHILTGHVDGIGVVEDIRPEGEGKRAVVRLPEGLEEFVAEKGSIALDGISLTVAAVREGGRAVEISLIPFTLQNTTAGLWRPGGVVNVEVDIIARYVVGYLKRYRSGGRGLSPEFLKEHGFL